MGGKTKQSQRTKNNVRPSSSGRSAELLSNSLKLDSSFVTTGSGKVLPALFPTLTATHIDQGLNPEYAVCFKKLHKKDPVTKVKALQELTELIKSGDIEDVVAALPSWANSYQTLTVDFDRRVREAVQVCNGALLSACGRRVAPQLRRLLPAWLLATADEHGPARAAARDSLQKTFPEGKLAEAISFCKSEILSLFIDNVTGNAEAMLSNKVEDPSERASQAARVVCASLQALQEVLLALPPAQHGWAADALAATLERDAFWQLAQHDAHAVRAAWYSCVSRVLCLVRAAEVPGRRVLRALLGRRERGAAPWTALLVIAQRHPDWHSWLDKRDLLVKRLLDVLESGGCGEARAVCCASRGVLRALPPHRRTDRLYGDYFDALLTGLNNKDLLSSKSERQIWISNLAECLQYLSEQNDDFVIEVVTSVHRKWLENIFTIQDNQARNNLIKHSAGNMASLIKNWLKQSQEEGDKKYDQIIRNCWQNIGSTVSTQIDKLSVEHKDITLSIESHILLLKTLKTEYLDDTKPKRSIKFADEEIKEEPILTKDELDDRLKEHFQHNLENAVEKTCCNYFDFAFKKQVSQFVFTSLITLIKEFESDRLFLSLARHFGCETVHAFYDKVLRSWLSGDTMRCRTLVDITFILVKFLSEEELDVMYNSFQQFSPQVVEWCLSPSLSLAGRGSSAGARWLRGVVAQAAVLGLARRADDRAANQLLLDCLHQHHQGELMVSESTVVQVLDVLSTGLDEQSDRAGVVAELAAQLVAKLANTKMIDHCETVILKIFDLALRDPGSVSVCARVCRVCGRGVRARALRRVSSWARRDLKDLDVARLERAASLCRYIIIPDEDVPEDVDEIAALARHLFDENFRPRIPLEVYALRCDCIFGNINCPIEDDNEFIKMIVETSDMDHSELSERDLTVYVYGSVFRSLLLRTIITRDPGVMAHVYFREQYGLVLYEYVVLKTLYDRYAFWHHYDIIHKTKKRLESLLEDIIEKTQYEQKASLLIYLSERAATEGYYWSYATRLFDDKVKEYNKIHPRKESNDPYENIKVNDRKSDLSKDVLEAKSIDRLEEIMTGNGFFHSLQAESSRSGRTQYTVLVRSLLAAHAHEPGVRRDVQRCVLAGDGRLAGVVDLYYTHKHVMLYERDLCAAPWSQIVSNAAIVDFLAETVEGEGRDMSAVEWDFANISLCSLVTSLRLSADRWECTKVSMLARPVLRLLLAVRSFVLGVPAAAAARPVSAHIAALAAEWNDIFVPDLNKNLFELLVIVLRSSDERMTSSRVATVSSIIAATERMNWDHIKTKTGETELKNIADVAISAMDRMTHHAYKYLAFFTLGLISKPLVLDDAEKLAAWSAREDDSPRPEFSLALYDDALLHLQEMADAALADVPGVCGSAVVWVSAGARVSVSLLLLAAALLRHAAAARTDLAHMYVELFRENKYAEWWMQTALRLLPPDVAAFALEECDSIPDRCLEYFEKLPDLDVYGWCDGDTVTRLACWVLAGALGGAGAGGARGWALAAAPRTARALQRLVPAAVAPPLVRRQLAPLAERAAELVDARVFVRRSAGEARCVLEVDERELELTVRFAPSHPLALPYVSTPPNSPAPDTHWIVLYLAYQNGTLLNALKMWIQAVTARVEASPQCYICYCRMHPSSGRLPTVPCHQCRNKFHTVCLRKWFSTSNKSNCPLCRSKF